MARIRYSSPMGYIGGNMAEKEKKEKWGLCSKRGWKVYMVFDTKEEAEKHLTNPKYYEVRKLL